jgi:nanoRNase/pAp phosphatase (c-di-AMP/oligoRNAs hydrolase)
VVIDHHEPPPSNGHNVPHFDVRTDVGATSTMVTDYLMSAGVEVTPDVATALFYGVKTDTADLSRNASALDFAAYDFLQTRVDRVKLARIRGSLTSVPSCKDFSQLTPFWSGLVCLWEPTISLGGNSSVGI